MKIAVGKFRRFGSLKGEAQVLLPVTHRPTRSLYLRWLLQRRGTASGRRIGVQPADGRLAANAGLDSTRHPRNGRAPGAADRGAPFDRPLASGAPIPS